MFYIFLVFYTYPAINERRKKLKKKEQESVKLLQHSNKPQNKGEFFVSANTKIHFRLTVERHSKQ